MCVYRTRYHSSNPRLRIIGRFTNPTSTLQILNISYNPFARFVHENSVMRTFIVPDLLLWVPGVPTLIVLYKENEALFILGVINGTLSRASSFC